MSSDQDKPSGFTQTLADNRLLWKFALASPVFYLILGQIFIAVGWLDLSTNAARPHDTAATQAIFLLTAVGIAIALAVLIWRRNPMPRSVPMSQEEAIRRWNRNFYIRLSLCDSLAFLGLFYYLLSARTWALMAGVTAAYAAYLCVYPRQGDAKALNQ